jgi:hypothetical protein
MVSVLLRVIIIVRCKGCGIWVLMDPVPAGDLALQLGGRGDGGRRSTGRPDDGDRGCREPEEEGTRKKSMSLENLRMRYSWWPSGSRQEGSPGPLIDVEAGKGETATLKVGKSTRL